ncbi:MAG TPA: LysR family transcriptional regulator [Burkholderiaceae bacterium]|nr:LysR family transcriptional regulator [Burkholderiaceae bacterium]
MNIEDLEKLMHVIRGGSFAAAARTLEVDPSSVSRSVSALEAELGARLFQRSTRRIALTEAGAVFAQRLEPLLEELRQARAAAVDTAGEARGILRVSVSNTFGLRRIVPLLPAFRRAHPALDLELLLTDALVDLVAERVDVAVRSGALQDSNLVAVPLLRTRYCVVASPAWARANRGSLRTPRDLERCDCLSFSLPGFRDRWTFGRSEDGPMTVVTVKPRLLVTNGLALRECTLGGMGATPLPDWLIDDDLAAGRLVDLFPRHHVAFADTPTAIWLVYPSRSYVPAKVRVFIDFMRKAISTPPRRTTERR